MKIKLFILGLLMFPIILLASLSPLEIFPTVLSSNMKIKLNQTISLKKTIFVKSLSLLDRDKCFLNKNTRKNHKKYRGEICELDNSYLPLLDEFTFIHTSNQKTINVKKRQTFKDTNIPSLKINRNKAKVIFKAPLNNSGKRVQYIGKIVDRAYNSTYIFHQGDYYIDSIDITSNHPTKSDTFFLKTKGKVRIFLNNDSRIIKRADEYKKRGYIEINYKRKSDKLIIFSKRNLLIDASRRLKMKGFIYGYKDITLISNINSTFIGAITAQGKFTLGKKEAKNWKQNKSGEYIYNKKALNKIDIEFDTDITKDTTPPKITLNGDANITIIQGDTYTEYGAKALDDIDGNINVIIDSNVNTSTIGNYVINYIAKDKAGNQAMAIRRVNVVASTLTHINLESNLSTLSIGDKTNLRVKATYSNNTTKELDSDIEWIIEDENIISVDSYGNITAVKAGTTTVKAKVNAIESNSLVVVVANNSIVLKSISISPSPINIRLNEKINLKVLGLYSDGNTSVIEHNTEYIISDKKIVSSDLVGLQVGSTTLKVKVGNINSSTINITVNGELNTSNFNFTNFGHRYLDQIPKDAIISKYDEKRFCMIAGEILSEDSSPLSGVKVSIFKRSKYGSTITNEKGIYTIPSEGGLELTLRYSKEGYTTIDRKINAPVQDWVRTPSVTMLKIDNKVTTIDFTNPTPQTHISTPVVDDRGSRSTTLVFNGVTKAIITSPNGSTREVTSLSVRATEFKTPESMPSDLPKESAYTYCSDLQADGVKDDETINFDSPVVMYVNNFLGFKVGEIVPVGYYDRIQGKWIGSDNGVVIKLIDTNNDGKVDALDSNGSGTPNDLNGNGSFTDEVAGLSNNPKYQVGDTLWRAEIMHFTPWDHNWPYGPSEDDEEPKTPEIPDIIDEEDLPNDCKVDINSYVTEKSRIFHEDISVAGTDITLHYSSKRVDGYKPSTNIIIDTTNAPKSLIHAEAILEVGGRIFKEDLELSVENKVKFEWDKKDILGNNMNGVVNAIVTVKYFYNLVYYQSSSKFRQAWAKVGVSATSRKSRGDIAYSKKQIINLDIASINSDTKSNELNIKSLTNANLANGWTFSTHSTAFNNSIYRGDGIIKKSNQLIGNIISTIAGNGMKGYKGDGDLAINASLNMPSSITVDIDGNLYIADTNNNRIRKIDKLGIITTVAGDGTYSYGEDEGLAIETPLTNPGGIAVDSDGNLYFIVGQNVRKIDKFGIITTIAGNGTVGYGGDGGLATKASLSYPSAIVLDSSGNLYISDTYNHCIRKVDTSGIITTVAGIKTNNEYGEGSGEGSYGGDGGLAIKASLNYPSGVTIDNNGNLYIADSFNHRIRKVDKFGIITTVAGNGDIGVEGDRGLATEAFLTYPKGIAVDSIGNLYITDYYNNSIRKVDTLGIITTIAGNYSKEAILSNPLDITIDSRGSLYIVDRINSRIQKIMLPSLLQKYNLISNYFMYKTSNNTADIFDTNGKHIKTIDLTTGNSLKKFGYDEHNFLVSITDQFNQTTTITRDTNGIPTIIRAPNGQITTLTVDENGDLIQVRYEDDSTYDFTYFDGSLMDIMTDPNGNIIKHIFDDNGRIIEEIDGENGSYRFVRNILENNIFYSTIQPEGETQTSRDIKLPNGDTQSLITLPTGDTITSTSAKDESYTTSTKDRVITKKTYTIDSLTSQKILASTETTQPSGLKTITNYTTTYDGNTTHTNSKTQTTTTNTKISTIVTDYNNGTTIITSPQHRVATRNYDINTRLTTSISTGTLTPTTYTYDEKGRITKEITGTREILYTYDSRGNISSITDPRDKVTTFNYDIMDRVISINYPNNTIESFSYDKNSNLLQRIVPTPANHNFIYNGTDNKTSYTSPLNKSTTYTYDKNKRVTAITRPSGATITNRYDKGRLVSTTMPDATIDYTYLFANKVASVTSGTESFNYTYDGSLLKSIIQSGVLNHTTLFNYNNDFQVTSSTYAGVRANYTYDNYGLIISSGAYSITRDAQNGYVTQLTDGTLTQNRMYNNYGEIIEIRDNIFSYELTNRDKSGAIIQKIESINNDTKTYGYIYDNMSRLIEVTLNKITIEKYTYDNNGNRASATINGVTTIANYTLDDQLEVYADNTYRYDEDGYLSEKTTPNGRTSYKYGTLGELKVVTTPTKNISYLHNANNQRVAKLIDGEIVEKYLWANLTTLLAIYNADDSLKQRFEYATQRMPIAMTMGSEKYYLHYDQVGSLRAVSDSSHTLIKEIVYDSFGNILSESNEDFKVPFGFAGGLYDTDTKLTRFGYRDYDAYVGKWTAKDPIGFGGGDSNLYGYVGHDPINFIDPTGEFAWLLLPLATVEGQVLIASGFAYLAHILNNKQPSRNDYGVFPVNDIGGGNICYYEPPPDSIDDLFPNAERVKSKNQRRRWQDSKNGDIYEWDYQHGDVEIYNKRGKHQGSQNPKTKKKKPAVAGRKTNK